MRLVLVLIICSGLTTGCVAQPKELTDEEVSRRAAEDLEFIDNFGEPLTEPLTLSRAMARALKYNLDYRLEWSKKVLAETGLNLSRYELLPDLVAQAGFTSRSNFSGASSRSLISGEESLEFSTSQDRDIFNANLELSWNVLDFGISYYRAKQAANEVLIAEEEKRKVIHRLLQNVRTAYWRAVAAKRLEPRLANVKTEVEQALARSREISDNNLDDPLQSLRYRRDLIDIKRQVEELEENFRMARIQLASLMSISDPSGVDVVVPRRDAGALALEHSLEELEQKALRQRPEIRQVDYRKRNAEHAAHAALMNILPVPRLHVSQNHNDNGFLYNNDWLIAGAQVSWNLLRFVSYPAAKRKAEAEQQTLDARSLTLSMAILTQVKVSMAQFLLSSKQFETQTAHMEVQSLIDKQVDAMASTRKIGKQARIREAMNTLLAEIRYNVARANLQKSHANLLMAAGLDPQIGALESKNLNEIERVLKENWPDMDIESAVTARDDSVNVVEAEAEPVSIVSSGVVDWRYREASEASFDAAR